MGFIPSKMLCVDGNRRWSNKYRKILEGLIQDTFEEDASFSAVMNVAVEHIGFDTIFRLFENAFDQTQTETCTHCAHRLYRAAGGNCGEEIDFKPIGEE